MSDYVRAADEQVVERLIDPDSDYNMAPAAPAAPRRIRASRSRRAPAVGGRRGGGTPPAAAASSSPAGPPSSRRRNRQVFDLTSGEEEEEEMDQVLADLADPSSAAAAAAAAYAPAAAAAAAEVVPPAPRALIELSRVVGGADVLQNLQCAAHGGDCQEHLPAAFVVMNCHHNCCLECYKRVCGTRHDGSAPPCPICRVAMDRVPRVNTMAAAVMASLKVSCSYAGCGAAYPLGHGMATEASHRDKCAYRPMECPTCHVAMRQGLLRSHLCPNATVACVGCRELVRRCDMEAHSAGGRPGACANMVPCPLGCVDSATAPVGVKNTPHAKRVRDAEMVQQRKEHATLVPRSAVAAHLAVCPCRVVACPFPGCAYEMVHHELPKHVGMKKYAAAHALCAMQALVAEKEATRAAMLALRQELHPQFTVNPFPGLTCVANDMFNLTTGVLTVLQSKKKEFAWEYRANQLPVDDVADIPRLEFEIITDAKDPDTAMLAIDVCVEPPIMHYGAGAAAAAAVNALQGGPRDMGISVRLCRAVKPGDGNALCGACTVPGVDYARFTSSFRITGNKARHRFDVFSLEQLAAAKRSAGDDRYVSTGNQPHFWLYVELFQRL